MTGHEILILGIVLVMLCLIITTLIIARRYKKAGSDEALIIYGRRRGPAGFRVVPPGHAKFVVPIVEAYKVLSLDSHKVTTRVADVITKQGVPVTIDVISIVGVSHEPDMIRRAAQRIISKPWPEVEDVCNEAIVAAVRSHAAAWELERINAMRDEFSRAIRTTAQDALSELGVTVIALTMRDMADQVGYLEALGKKRTAEVKREAIIGESAARRDAIMKSAQFDKEGQMIRIQTDEEIERAKIDSKRRLNEYEAGKGR